MIPAVAPAPASDATLSVLLFFPFLPFLATGEDAEAEAGPSVLPVAIPMVTSLPALILPGGAEMEMSSSSLRPGIGLCVTRVARDQREGAARSGRRDGCVPCRSPKEMDISCSRMDWSRRRMCLSIFERKKQKRDRPRVRWWRQKTKQSERKTDCHVPSRTPLVRGRLFLGIHARPLPSTSLGVVGARGWCAVLGLRGARCRHGMNGTAFPRKANREC